MSSTDLDVVRRWEASGGGWRVVAHGADRVTVALLTCDGGEEMHRLESGEDALLTYLGGRASSED